MAEPKVQALTVAARGTKKGNLLPSFIVILNELIHLIVVFSCLPSGKAVKEQPIVNKLYLEYN